MLALAANEGSMESDLPLIINGCSDELFGASHLSLGSKISCMEYCDLHDLRYFIGDDANAQRQADMELRKCANSAGKTLPEWLAIMRKESPKLTKVICLDSAARRAWCRARA